MKKRSSFFSSFASIFDLSGGNRGITIAKSDADALSQDWQIVGDEMKKSAKDLLSQNQLKKK